MPDLLIDIWSVVSRLNVRSLLDILILSFILYWILVLLKGTTAITLIRGIFIVSFLGFLVSSLFQLTVVGWLLRQSLPALFIIIAVLFQPELRRLLEQVGRRFPLLRGPDEHISEMIDVVCEACDTLSRRGHGALMVFERDTGLQDYIDKGVKVDAATSPGLLVGIFLPDSPLHDGAVILRSGRVEAARCVLPLSENSKDPRMGTRHRAALGISEHSDAISVVVSEETGRISVASDGRLIPSRERNSLKQILADLHSPNGVASGKGR